MADTAGLPSTWAELRAPESGILAKQREQVQVLVETLALLEGQLASLPQVMAPHAEDFAAIAALAGPEAARAELEKISAAVPQALKMTRMLGSTGAISWLALVNAGECAGAPSWSLASQPAAKMLEGVASNRKGLSEVELYSAALAAIAAGETKLVPKLLNTKPAPDFTPGKTFLFNVQGFTLYLAAAKDKGASAADVAPAWRDFVLAFPRKLTARTLGWNELLWAARIYFHDFEKRPAAEVAGALHAQVSAL